MAAAQRMPTRELEILGIAACKVVADVGERVGFPVRAEQRVVVAQNNSYPDNKIKLLPPLMVCGSVGDVGLCGGEAAGVLIAASIDPTPGVESRRALRGRED